MKRITALVCALLLVLSLAACGSKTSTPEKTVDAFFAAMQKMDFDAMNDCTTQSAQIEWDLGASDLFPEETAQQLLDTFRSLAAKMEYTVGEATVDSTTASVPVTATYPDASAIVRDAMTDVMAGMIMSLLGEESEDDVYSQLIGKVSEKVAQSTPAMKTAELVLPLTKTDDGWRISALSDDVMNVLSSNMGDAFAEAEETLGN